MLLAVVFVAVVVSLVTVFAGVVAVVVNMSIWAGGHLPYLPLTNVFAQQVAERERLLAG